MTDPLGDRMKRYEDAARLLLPQRTYTVIRVDGRAFHSLTRVFARPFDAGFVAAMNAVGVALCEAVSGARMGYVQSDEASVVVTDFESHGTEPWFGGVAQKMASVAASIATDAFAQEFPHLRATFDGRAFTIPSEVEVENYLIWRQRDATRNSILAAGQHVLGHKACDGLDTDEIQEALHAKGVNWNDYPVGHKRGRVVERVTRRERVRYTDKRTGQERETDEVERSRWEVVEPPVFERDRSFLRDRLPRLPSFGPSAEVLP